MQKSVAPIVSRDADREDAFQKATQSLKIEDHDLGEFAANGGHKRIGVVDGIVILLNQVIFESAQLCKFLLGGAAFRRTLPTHSCCLCFGHVFVLLVPISDPLHSEQVSPANHFRLEFSSRSAAENSHEVGLKLE